ncbi:FAR-17a/AIG1-like protein [Syncephalastrum racemosum]|uniref:FAR-17a/AIG1-like protein n=1 Tax=Syncephalastrum racemosum TaxID=13706 RepID=A0A1X2HUC8_SYNRA|nr:FAR-17a/AIG1-like protein [Syncephalastrum racemosum]
MTTQREPGIQWGSLLLNLLGFVSNSIALYAANFVYENPYAVGFGGHFQYLTIIGLTTATLAFGLKLCRFALPGALPRLHETLSHLAIPVEGSISLLYWTMVLVDPGLLIPEDVPPIPMILDCALHLYPAVFLWSDFLIFNLEFKRSYQHVAAIYGFTLFYLAWSWMCQLQNGYWPYPFLDQVTLVVRLLIYFSAGTLCWFIYEAGAFMHTALHARRMILRKKAV